MFGHGFLGFCIWDIPALIVLAAIIVLFAVHSHKMKREEKELEEGLSDKWAEESVNSGDRQ